MTRLAINIALLRSAGHRAYLCYRHCALPERGIWVCRYFIDVQDMRGYRGVDVRRLRRTKGRGRGKRISIARD